MGRLIRGARRVPADAVRAYGEAELVRAEARREAERILEEARREAERILEEARGRAGRLREEAAMAGRAEGIAAAAEIVARARSSRAAAAELRRDEIVDLALAVARRVVADCHEVDRDLAVRRAVETIGRRFLGRVRVRVARDLAAGLREALARRAETVEVEIDETLAAKTCILEGDGGEVRLDDDEILERIRNRLMADVAESGSEST